MKIIVRSFALIILQSTLMIYLLSISNKSSAFVEVWPLEIIWLETVTALITIIIVTWLTFLKALPASVATSIVLLFLIVFLPVIKYPNDKLLYGPWDSTAFYSFTKWIILHGHIASGNELYYSTQYATHPGIALLPAIFQKITGVSAPLTLSMYTILFGTYLTYVLLLLSLIKLFIKLNNYTIYLIVVSTIFLFGYFSSYYGGVEIGYVYAGLILYTIISIILRNNIKNVVTIAVKALMFTGLVVTHYSTAVIITFYIILITIFQLIYNQNKKKITLTTLTFVSIFLTYELYVDVYLSSSTLQNAFNILTNLYIRELELATKSLGVHTLLTYTDLLKYLLGLYTKHIIILASILFYSLIMFIRWNHLTKIHKLLFILLLITLPTWIIGWAGVGSFMAGGRALALIQFVLILNVAYFFTSIKYDSIKSLAIFIAFTTIIAGFIFNYGLPILPLIQTEEGDTYTYPTFSQGAITVWSLHPIEFSNSFLDERSPYFLCIQPYTGFGLCDLLWNKPKIPQHGFITPQFAKSAEIIKLLAHYRNVVIPIPTNDRVLPGPIGYTSLYTIPDNYCTYNCRGRIYTNYFYNLYIS